MNNQKKLKLRFAQHVNNWTNQSTIIISLGSGICVFNFLGCGIYTSFLWETGIRPPIPPPSIYFTVPHAHHPWPCTMVDHDRITCSLHCRLALNQIISELLIYTVCDLRFLFADIILPSWCCRSRQRRRLWPWCGVPSSVFVESHFHITTPFMWMDW